jgi:hypothetical protein
MQKCVLKFFIVQILFKNRKLIMGMASSSFQNFHTTTRHPFNKISNNLFPFFQRDFFNVLKVPEWLTFLQSWPKCVPDVFDCTKVWTAGGPVL